MIPAFARANMLVGCLFGNGLHSQHHFDVGYFCLLYMKTAKRY